MATKKVTKPEKTTKAKTTTGKTKKITEEDVRKKAQEIFEDRMSKGIHGNAESDWLAAEKILKSNKK